ncbi:hypothetical protein AB0F11_27565 [Streptomyces sp. NPDC032472]|uniref:hypothetical protein n=1 Tax=Streptomyces sp. NPDC032472 TaxID=3155018 RepID=UPI0033FDEBEE
MKVRTPADFCKDRETLLDPAVRTVISIAGVEEQKQGGFNVLGATEPELKCGPGVDNDGYFEVNLPLGPYYLAPDAKIHLLTYDEKATQGTWQAAPASVATLREVVKACKTGEQPSKPYTCGGNLFHATVNKNGVITDLTAVFQS